MSHYLLDTNHNLIDAIIAIAAIRYGLILLTTDRDFQRIPDLRRETWR